MWRVKMAANKKMAMTNLFFLLFSVPVTSIWVHPNPHKNRLQPVWKIANHRYIRLIYIFEKWLNSSRVIALFAILCMQWFNTTIYIYIVHIKVLCNDWESPYDIETIKSRQAFKSSTRHFDHIPKSKSISETTHSIYSILYIYIHIHMQSTSSIETS